MKELHIVEMARFYNTCNEAVKKWGTLQLDIAIEESSELIQAICKIKREKPIVNSGKCIDALVDEMADVHIMLMQLNILFDIDDRVNKRIMEKIERLEQKMEERA